MQAKPFAFALAASSVAVLLVACGGGGDGTPAATPTPVTTTISGSAVKGPVSGATVRVLDAATRSELGTTTTGTGGSYSLSVPFTGDVIVEVTGGTYTDEATGASTQLSAPLRVVLNANGGTVTGVVTPLTTMAYTYAFSAGKTVSASAYNTMATTLASQFQLGSTNLATTVPVVSGSLNDYGKVLAALSKYMQLNSVNLQSLVSTAYTTAQWTQFSGAFTSAYSNAISGSNITFSFDGTKFVIDGAGTGTGGGTGGTGGTGNLTVSVKVAGAASPDIVLTNMPKPASQQEFCSDLQNDSTFSQLGAAGGGTLKINSCTYSGNTGTIDATLTITSPYALTLPYQISYKYN